MRDLCRRARALGDDGDLDQRMAKTTGRWRYERHTDNTYTWHSPHHRIYPVDHTGSHTIG